MKDFNSMRIVCYLSGQISDQKWREMLNQNEELHRRWSLIEREEVGDMMRMGDQVRAVCQVAAK